MPSLAAARTSLVSLNPCSLEKARLTDIVSNQGTTDGIDA